MKRRGLNPVVPITILLIVLALCVGSSFFILNNQKSTLSKAEANLPESAISTYFKQIKNNDFDGIFNDSLIIEPHLNSKESYIEALKNIYKDLDVEKLGFIKDGTQEDMYQIVDGNKLVSNLKLIKSNEGKYLASTIFTGDNNYTVQEPLGLTLLVNGNELDDKYITQKEVIANNFSGLTNKDNAPIVNTYQINNLISEPEISIKESGYGITKDVLNNYYYVGKLPTDNDYKTVFENAAKAVAKYPTKDGGLGAIPYITGSDFYNRIKTLDNQWYAPHGTASFSNVEVKDVVMQSDGTMIGNITMDYYIASSSASKNYHIGYQITFLNNKIAGFAIDNDLNPLNKEE